MSSRIRHVSLAPPALEGAVLPVAGARAGWARLRRLAAYAIAIVVLLLVFLSYLNPDMLFTLATQVWSCF
jgi:hypothetical protein